ncbi:uncharacterized protein LOC115448613 [Manduca sexta]|uniref:uncharacterized protein LOC115448613 n=1 Tax=Manduca sexta TaxID=7130 RepID=UPI00188E965D|nr:uncharacterized protein LOC115448613 [Manduca sexta]
MAPVSKLGRGKPLKNQTKEVLWKTYKYFQSQIEKDPNSTVTAIQLVKQATGVSSFALKRLLSVTSIDKSSEKKPSQRQNKEGFGCDDYDAQAIRRIIHNSYTKDVVFESIIDLYRIVKADLDYQGSLFSLRRRVTKLGFTWIEKDKNNVLIEKHEFRYPRIQFLTKIEAYRAQGRDIVYTGEMVVESRRKLHKPRLIGPSTSLKPAKNISVILLAGDAENVVKSTIYIFNDNNRYEKDVNESKRENFEHYEKWFKYYLLPTLKPNSIIVIDSGTPFHNRMANPMPHATSPRSELMDYLTARGIPYSADMYKSQLYQLVVANQEKYPEYKTEALFREHGHTALRLPIQYPDLNPIKFVLSSITNYIGDEASLSTDSITNIAKKKVYSLPDEGLAECPQADKDRREFPDRGR